MKKINYKKIVKIVISAIILLSIVVGLALYIGNEGFRNFFDMQILRKEVTENNLVSIELNADSNQSIYAYDKYITILEKNILKNYVSSGEKSGEIEIEISNPIYDSNHRFLAIAEKNGQKFYLISGNNIIWQNSIEGQINKISVNKNGYVSIIVTGTTYQTIVITYNSEGKELFKTYLSTTSAIDTDISNDNKYLAIAEVDISGTLISSSVKVVSIEKAQTEPTNSVIEKYQGDINSVIIDINYQEKNKLYCMYDDCISLIRDGTNKELVNLKDKKVTFADINLEDAVIVIEEEKNLFNSKSKVRIMNGDTQREYSLENNIKNVSANNNEVAINMLSEAHFINDKGWLLKKYISLQEIKNIVLGDSIAGVIYREKIEIVNL